MPSGCLSTKDRIGVGWAAGCCWTRENNRDNVVSGVAPVVQCEGFTSERSFGTMQQMEQYNCMSAHASASGPLLHPSWNFLTISQLQSNCMYLHYQLIKAGSNQKERRYNIRFVMCDPIRTAAVACPLLGCHGKLTEKDLVVQSTKNCEESAASGSVDQQTLLYPVLKSNSHISQNIFK